MVVFDITNDFESVCNDFRKTATLRVDTTDTALPSVLATPKTIKELEPSGAKVTRDGMQFTWARSYTPTQPPVGSIIIDANGTYWTIWKVTNRQRVETYAVFCLDLNIVTAASNYATVLRADYVKGTANEAKAVWRGLWSNHINGNSQDTIKAHFQQSEETSELEFGSEWRKEMFRVYFQDPVPMTLASGEYRLVDTAGFRYQVLRYFCEGRIDKLPIAFARRITEGNEYHDGPGDEA